jgi:hypothetical protein
MSDLLAIRPGMIALRVKHAGEPSIAHGASTIVSQAESLGRRKWRARKIGSTFETRETIWYPRSNGHCGGLRDPEAGA